MNLTWLICACLSLVRECLEALFSQTHTHIHKLTILDYFSLFGISFLFSEQNGTQACVAPVFPFVLIVLGDGSTCSGSYLLSYAVKCSSLAALWRQEVCAWKKLECETENHTTQQKTIWGKKRQPVIGSFVASKPPILALILDLKLSGAPFDSQEYKFGLNSCYKM